MTTGEQVEQIKQEPTKLNAIGIIVLIFGVLSTIPNIIRIYKDVKKSTNRNK